MKSVVQNTLNEVVSNTMNSVYGSNSCTVEQSDETNTQTSLSYYKKRSHDMAELMEAVYVEIGLDFEFSYVNPYALALIEYSLEDVEKGLECRRVFPEWEIDRVIQVMTKALCNDYGNKLEWEVVTRNGEVKYIEAAGYPLYDEKNMIIGLKVFGREITTIKKTEALLQSSEHRFGKLFSHSPMGLVMFFKNGTILKQNNAFNALYASQLNDDVPMKNIQSLIQINPLVFNQLNRGQVVTLNGKSSSEEEGGQKIVWRISSINDTEGDAAPYIGFVQYSVTKHNPIIGTRSNHTSAESAISAAPQEQWVIKDNRHLENFVFNSVQMKKVISTLPSIANLQSPVLLRGESGTGKEIIANLIQEYGEKTSAPFISINCGSIPDSLIESELFGFKAGAFTDAKHDKKGKVELAHGGILFLDEVGDMPFPMQVKLLRLLEQKKFYPLGSEIEVEVDVRIVAATHQPLEQLVTQKLFRQDLYYRLNVIKINLPPLRERTEDIPELSEVFLSKANVRNGKKVKGFSDGLKQFFNEYSFPGNIRELENIINHMVIFCSDTILSIDDLSDDLQKQVSKNVPKKELQSDEVTHANLEIKSSQPNDYTIQEALLISEGNKTRAAQLLGIHRTTLFRKLKGC